MLLKNGRCCRLHVMGSKIAHIAVVNHPEFRARGIGKHVVSAIAAQAQKENLIPHYQTVKANRTSVRIACELGFKQYVKSVAVRF